jgi:hypothetical protein
MDFNNASVAAFVGAAFAGIFAVIAVAITDRLRDRRTVETIRGEIETARGHAENKLETVREVLRLFREKGQFRSGEIMKFDVSVVRELKARVLHLLDPRQRQALDAVLFRMEGTDSLLAEVSRQQEEFRPKPGWQVHFVPPPNQLAQHDTLLADAITNLKVLVEMAGKYAAGDLAGITQKHYRAADYADPPAESATPTPTSG